MSATADIGAHEPAAVELTAVLHTGRLDRLADLLDADPGLANVVIRDAAGGGRTPLHLLTDWPGYVAGAPAAARLLGEHGADPDVRMRDPRHRHRGETPLHWAASSDDVDVAEALLDIGADVSAAGGSIGTPIENAVGYGCWRVAELLARRGARIDTLWVAAALGRLADVERLCAADPQPDQQQLDEAFWQACHGGQRRAAEHLVGLGADVNATQDHSDASALDAATDRGTSRDLLATWLVERGAHTGDRRRP